MNKLSESFEKILTSNTLFSRRRVICGMCLAVGGVCFGIGCTESEVEPKGGPLALSTLDVLRKPYTIFELERVAVLWDARGLAALSLVCTHQTCLLEPDERGLTCPCHGSHFDWDGVVQNGPAVENLAWYKLALDSNGMLSVDRGERVSPEWRLVVQL